MYSIQDPIAKSRLPVWILKIIRFEFWPMWFFYLPSIPVWVLMMIRSRRLLYFTAANPGIELGGFFGESKSGILKQIPHEFLPGSLYIPADTPIIQIAEKLSALSIHYPLIGKPDVGERGNGVVKIVDEKSLEDFVRSTTGNLIFQEYLDYPLELGVLYYKFPDGSGSGITSITMKEFLTVTGDGYSSVRQLLEKSTRGRMQIKRLLHQQSGLMRFIPESGKNILVEPVGNHCRGTLFLNGNHLINSKLIQVFDKITENMDSFFFGRFDLKVNSLQDLYLGKNIRIMELNGTTSEPAHIYDPGTPLWRAYRDVISNMELVRKISSMNIRKGIPTTSVPVFIKTVYSHFSSATN